MLKASKNAEIQFTNLTIKEILEMLHNEIKMLTKKKAFTKEKAIKLFKDIKTENTITENEEEEEEEILTKRISGKHFSFDYGPDLSYKEINAIKTKLTSKFPLNTINYKNGIFNIVGFKRKEIKSTSSFEVLERTPNIKNIRSCDFNELVQPDSNIIIEAFHSFLTCPSDTFCTIIAGELKQYLQNIKICIYSEYLFSSLIFKYLIDVCHKNKWKDTTIFSIDSKIELPEDTLGKYKKIKNFRCDLILIFDCKLFIFEYKYGDWGLGI
jgi:hypothetical protein